jgi:hypothetical protein
MTAGPLDAELAAFCESGVSIVVACRGPDGWPIVGIAVACAADAAAQRLRLVLSREPNRALLSAVAQSGALAATFSQPGSHRSIQVKGGALREDAAHPDDIRRAAEQTDAFCRTLVQAGYSEALASAYCAHNPADLAALSFSPSDAFLQTPGPGAGGALPR